MLERAEDGERMSHTHMEYIIVFKVEDCRLIDCEQLHSSINCQLIAGCFGHVGLRQLVLYAADEGLRGQNVLQSVVN